MSCSFAETPDWKAYAMGELAPEDCCQAEAHAADCSGCREELTSLRLTLDTLSTLREEEVQRRIAFVSDKVFEPRWWQRLFQPTFAAACVVAVAILVHAAVYARPAGPAASRAQIQADIDAAVTHAVTQAVAQVEARHAEETANMAASYDFILKQFRQIYVNTSGIVRQ